MGKNLLTPAQNKILELAKSDRQITKWFYFTGGTALAVYYLHHRYSEDLDFFTTSQVNATYLDKFFKNKKKELGFTKLEKKVISGLVMYRLKFPNDIVLKIDFNEYDFPQVERGTFDGPLRIDSLYDIAINKFYTILSRIKARDYVDLYCCIQKIECSLDQLLPRTTDKFGSSYDSLYIAQKLANAADIADFPRMIIPFDKQKMVDFFLGEAKKFENKIFK